MDPPHRRTRPSPLLPERGDERRAILEQTAKDLGQRWAKQKRRELHLEGRPAAGGWPGTLREARTRVEQEILPEVLRQRMSPVTAAEREAAAHTAYASARSEWMRNAEPDIY